MNELTPERVIAAIAAVRGAAGRAERERGLFRCAGWVRGRRVKSKQSDMSSALASRAFKGGKPRESRRTSAGSRANAGPWTGIRSSHRGSTQTADSRPVAELRAVHCGCCRRGPVLRVVPPLLDVRRVT